MIQNPCSSPLQPNSISRSFLIFHHPHFSEHGVPRIVIIILPTFHGNFGVYHKSEQTFFHWLLFNCPLLGWLPCSKPRHITLPCKTYSFHSDSDLCGLGSLDRLDRVPRKYRQWSSCFPLKSKRSHIPRAMLIESPCCFLVVFDVKSQRCHTCLHQYVPKLYIYI